MRKNQLKPLLVASSLASLALSGGCAEDLPRSDEASDLGLDSAALSSPSAGRDRLAAEVGERYVIVFRDEVRGAAAVRAAGAHVALSLPNHRAVAAYVPARALDGLRRNPNVAWLEPDAPRQPFAEVKPYGITMVQADQLVDDASTSGATVCIIDSGYSRTHEDLAANPNVTYATDIGTGDASVDGCGHGTHVAGTIAGVGGNGLGVVGVNPSGNLKLHIVKVFGNDCGWAYSSTLVKALDACRTVRGKLIVNMSLGGGAKSRLEESAFANASAAGVLSIAAAGNDGSTRKSYPASYPSVISVAAIDARKVVANFSQKNDSVTVAAPGVGVLSTVPWRPDASLSVGGVSYAGGVIDGAAETTGVTSELVSGGLCSAIGPWAGKVVLCERGALSLLDVVRNAEASGAVGVAVYNGVSGGFTGTLGAGNASVIPAIALTREDGLLLVSGALGLSAKLVNTYAWPASGYEAWNGTSMATPHVAGVAALVWNKVPSATQSQLRTALLATAEDLGVGGKDTAYGYGLVRAKNAYDYLIGQSVCTPTQATETSCGDGLDNDCDGLVDTADANCQSSGGCTLGQLGAACTVNSDCCSNACKGPTGRMTCK